MDELKQREKLFFEKLKGFFEQNSQPQVATQEAKSSGDIISNRSTELLNKISSGRANWAYWLGLIPVLALAWYLRTRNLPLLAGKYLIELDSYFFFRYAKIIYETGSLPAIDMMRYVPLGFMTAPYKFFPLTMTYFYKFIHAILPSLTQLQWHIYYPPAITLISFIFFFLFVKEMFDHKTALVSTTFLAVIPAYIQRTSAGFADHEAMAMLWMFASLWLFALMWKSENWQKAMVFGALSGLFAGLMAMTWGGFRFLTLIIPTFVFASLLFYKSKKQTAMGYAAWSLVSVMIISPYYGLTLSSFLGSIDVVLILFSLLLLVIYFLPLTAMISAKIKLNTGLTSLFLTAILLTPLALLFKAISLDLIRVTFNPNPQRWAATVSESQQPSFFGGGGWTDSYGLLIWFALLCGALALYKIYELKTDKQNLLGAILENKFSLGALLIYSIFVLAFIQSRSGKYAFGSGFFSNTYMFWLLFMIAALFLVYLYAQRSEKFFNEEKVIWIFTFLWILLTLVLARMQIRLLFAFTPVAAFASGVFVTKISRKLWDFKPSKLLAIGLILLVGFAFYSAAGQALAANRYMSSMVPGKWEAAMTFLREQTPADSVVAHWWDYGHMTTAIGERAAVTDGGNVRGWNHASGRYFLTGKNDTETLEYFKSHNVTHFLISEEEIQKYPAFSLIASDENFDRYSSIGVFALQQQREVRDGTMLLFGGSWALDKDVVLNNMILPVGQAAIAGFSVIANNNTLSTPIAYVAYNGQQYQFGLSCIYVNGQRLEFKQNDSSAPVLKGCMVLAPYLTTETQGNPTGVAFWASEKVWDTLFARLYLYGEQDQFFKPVYADNTPLGVYQGRIIGPIKIWEVRYPDGIETNSKYLEPSPYG